MSAVTGCGICAQLPQKISDERLPKATRALVDASADTKRCPDCGTLYYYRYDHDPGEPMVPATDTYTLMRLTPVLAREQLKDAPAIDPGEWDALHHALAAAIPALSSPHIVKHVVESLTDYYLERGDRASFIATLLRNQRADVRANAAADFLFVATEEHPVWMVRAFSRHQQKLAAPWLQDSEFTAPLLDALVSGLDAEDETISIDATLGNQSARVCDVAYHGLSNAIYRKLDPASILPRLHALAAGPSPRARERASRLLADLEERR